MTGLANQAFPRLGYWPNIEPRFWRGQLVERQWHDGRLGSVLGWDDEDHCWVHWRTRAHPSQTQIECEAAEDLIAWYPVNPLHAADANPFQAPAPDTEKGTLRLMVERLRGHVHILAGCGPHNRVSNPHGLTAARDYVRQQLTSAGWQPQVHEFDVRPGSGSPTGAGRGRCGRCGCTTVWPGSTSWPPAAQMSLPGCLSSPT